MKIHSIENGPDGKRTVELNLWPESTLADAHLRPQRVVPKLAKGEEPKPVTRDCYAAHVDSWCGAVTPRRPGAE